MVWFGCAYDLATGLDRSSREERAKSNHGFTEEHRAKLESCQSIDELKEVARDLGMELSDEQIEGEKDIMCNVILAKGDGRCS